MRKVTYKQELVDNNIELSVRHLKQFFKFGHGASSFKTKAVHDVSFDIKKGECFGLVGESGCGKTTTGRSILRLYNITSGSVYFEGYRIAAGKRWNEKEIKWSRIKGNKKIKQLEENMKSDIFYSSISPSYASKIADLDKSRDELEDKLVALSLNYKQVLFEISGIDDIDLAEQKKAEAKAKFKNDKKALKQELADLNNKINAITREAIEDSKNLDADKIAQKKVEISAKYTTEIMKIKEEINKIREEQLEEIRQINFDNKHVSKKLMSKMQMIFQDPVDSLDPRMTVQDIIEEGLEIQGMHNKFANSKKVAEVLKKVGLIPEFASRYPHEFSGGQRQRIGIARALVMNPTFLICDEPISALDVSIRAQIINLLNELKEEMGLTIMFIAHDLSVVKYFCDRIAVMYFGQMVELATSEELFKHPLHPYAKALLSAIPKPDPLSEKTRQRIVYDPSKEHDYSKEKPTFQEILPGHFILANSEEMEKYRQEIKEIDSKRK